MKALLYPADLYRLTRFYMRGKQPFFTAVKAAIANINRSSL